MNQVGYFNEANQEIAEIEELKMLVNYALNKLNLKNVIFDVIIVNNDRIREINKSYRNIDKPTDVISFALEDIKDIELEVRLLGDIYISIDKAVEQAKIYEHSLLRELSFLTIHGLLHLLGFDHESEETEKIMFDKQEMILDGYGIKREK